MKIQYCHGALVSDNKTFCVKPFIQYSSFNTGDFRLCCSAKDPDVRISTEGINIKDFFKSDYLTEVQRKMRAGEKINECIECYELEERGACSDRLDANEDFYHLYPEKYKALKNGTLDLPGPMILDLRVGNECNLKCQSCFPDLSNQVYDDRVKLNSMLKDIQLKIPPQKNLPAGFTVEQLIDVLPHIEELKLIGGEPLISKSGLRLLEYCNEKGYSKNIVLRLHTNLTVFNLEFMKVLSGFKKVVMTFSIDGYGELNNYLRYPSKWEKITKNLKSFISISKDFKNFRFKISPVIQISNITSLHKLLNFFISELKLHDHKITISPINLMDPDYLSPTIAPTYIKDKAIELFMNEYNKYDYNIQKNYEDFMKEFMTIQNTPSDERLLKKYFKITDSFDLIRNQSIAEVFPEYKELRKNII